MYHWGFHNKVQKAVPIAQFIYTEQQFLVKYKKADSMQNVHSHG